MNIQKHAWQFKGKAQALILASKTMPLLEDGQIVVENLYAGINPVDWKFIEYDPRNWPVGQVPGVDGVGVVIDANNAEHQHLIGKTVAYHCSLAFDGSFATHTILYADRVISLSSGFDLALAASLPCPLLTAWQAFQKIPVISNQRVLITGMGAVNKLLAQLLTDVGFTVDVISKSLSEAQGTALKINKIYRDKPDFSGYYAIFDANGQASATALVPYLRANGHIICILGRIDTPVDDAFTRTISYHEIALGALHNYGDKQQWQALIADGSELLSKIANGKIQVESPSVFTFENLNEALMFSKIEQKKAVVKIKP